MIKNPKEIYKILDEYVVGQAETKKNLSNAIFLHTIRSYYNEEASVDILDVSKKSNMLLVGPSGSGKTLMLELIANKVSPFPVYIINAKEISQPGWVGTSLVNIIENCWDKRDEEVTKRLFSHSIIIIDEFDKICLSNRSSKNEDVNTLIQHSILTYLQGSRIKLHKFPNFNTNNVLFILAGNFEQLRIDRKKNKKTPVGFVGTQTNQPKENMHEELIKQGMITEIAGRVSVISELDELTQKDLMSILIDGEHPLLGNYQNLFDYMGYDLQLGKKDLNNIVKEAYKTKTGARGLQAALDKIIVDCVFDIELE